MMSGMVVQTVISSTQEAETGGLWFEASPGKSFETLSEKKKLKKDWLAQVVGCFASQV
jgi:hypothetical protein